MEFKEFKELSQMLFSFKRRSQLFTFSPLGVKELRS